MELDSQAQKFLRILDELAKLYGALQEVLVGEKKALLAVDLTKIADITKSKEVLLYKIRALDKQRVAAAQAWALQMGLDADFPRLLQMADHLQRQGQVEIANHLRSRHKVIALHVQQSTEQNSENEIYVQSAQRLLSGAMDEIKQVVSHKPTYGKSGAMAGSTETQAGNFVSKEA